jgi:hypothetical protein
MVLLVISNAEEVLTSKPLLERFEDIYSGKYVAQSWPFPILTEQSQSLLPGSVVIIAGSPGAGKTFFMLQSIRHWIQSGVKVAVMELEENFEFYSHRLLAIEAGFINILDPKWIKKNEEQSREILRRNLDAIEKIVPSINFPDPGGMNMKQAAEWIERKAREKNRIIVIDPITMIQEGKEPWAEAPAFIARIKIAVLAHGCTLVCVSHPKKGFLNKTGDFTLDDIAGPAAFTRFISSAFALQHVEMDEPGDIRLPDGSTSKDTWNKTIRIMKVREGRGTSKVVCYNWIANTATFSEVGIKSKDATSVKGRK